MNILNNITIKGRLILSFTILVLLFILFATFSIVEMNKLSGLTNTLYEHPLQVSNAAITAGMGVFKMQISMKDAVLALTEYELQNVISEVLHQEMLVIDSLDVVRDRILGTEGAQLEREVREAFLDWKVIREEVIGLIYLKETALAVEITKQKGDEYVHLLERKMLELTAYARNKAGGFINDANIFRDNTVRTTIGIIIIVAVICIITAYLIISSILSSVAQLKTTMSDISITGKLKKANLKGKNEITEMSLFFNGLIDKLEEQLWLKDSVSIINTELSGDLSLEEILNKSVNTLCRNIGACTGAIYLYNKENSRYEIGSSFALTEGSHFIPAFKNGRGIIGQAGQDKKSILLKNITGKDAAGTTAANDDSSKSIYAVPLIYKDDLYGVLEAAVFNNIDTKHRELIETSAETIAVNIYTAIQKKQIKDYLTVTQDANEKLQAQTEELQAQTEELQAQTEELQSQSKSLSNQNTELEMQRQQVEEANQLKSEFLSNMSHELRTPLNSVLALSKVLVMQTGKRLTDEEIKYLHIIERNGKQLLSLINNILDLSKIEAGKMEISLKDISVKSIIETIHESIEPVSSGKNNKIILNIQEDLPALETDESKLYQVLQNIMSNAVKFTKNGEIVITAAHERDEVKISISDTGIGIKKKDLPHIFDEFRQVDGSSSRAYDGTGLGLAIAYRIMKMLNGNIFVKSEIDRGSTFTVLLPVKWKGPEKAGKLKHHPDFFSTKSMDTSKKNKTILIVDDEPETVRIVSDYLLTEGYNTITTGSGEEAVELAAKFKPFAITLDIFMPDMDGWEVLQELKKNEDTSDIPVIIISVSDNKEMGFTLGAVGYVTKPVKKQNLISEIHKITDNRACSVLITDDNKADRDNIANHLKDAGYQTSTAENGRICLSLIQKSKPDLLILDLLMPEMDGFTVIEELHKNPETDDIPVIIVTAKDLTAADRKKLESQAAHILQKSGNMINALLKDIKQILYNINHPVEKEKQVIARKNLKVLLVEDNEVAAIQVQRILMNDNYNVAICKNGYEALEYVKQSIPDCIILDLMMPGMDGFAVLDNLKKNTATAKIPVLILTAKNISSNDLKRLAPFNIQHLIQKGDVNKEDLLSSVRNMIGINSITEEEPQNIKISRKKIPNEDTTILVVEDNPDNLITVEAMLGNKYKVISEVNGEAGLKTAFLALPDLILLDISLPKMDGFSVVRELKADSNTNNIPVIAMTAHAMTGDKEKILSAGCDDYISKPIDPEIFLDKIKKWIQEF